LVLQLFNSTFMYVALSLKRNRKGKLENQENGMQDWWILI